nr:hypothetical protein [Tanacetum cinerariifolium]
MQTQTSNTLHNAIMEAGSKDRPPMLAPGNYVQWKSKIKRYIDTKPNHELIYYCLENPPYKLDWQDIKVPVSEGSPITTTEGIRETYKNVSQDGESINVQDLKTNLYGELGKFTSQDGESLESYYSRSQQAATRNRGKEIVNSPQPVYGQEPSMVSEDDETSKDKEIDKLMALISLSFKKIYKPTNNNLRTSSNTSRVNQDNSPRINRSAGYENQRIGNVPGARETVGSSVVQISGIQCYNCKEFGHVAREYQELEAHYMYMAQLQEVSTDAADSRPIFDDEPLQKVSTDDHYNVFAMESVQSEQSKSDHDTYPTEQDAQNMIIDSLDISYDREEIDQNDDDNDLAKERELLASLIKKLKCEIDESKNRNKFLETSNKDLIEKLKGIDNDIYSTVDACPNACEMWRAIKRFVTLVKQSQELKTVSYHKLYDILKQHQHEVNEIRAEKLERIANPLALVAQQQPVYHPQTHPTHYKQNSSTRSQQDATRNRGKAIVNSPQPIYDQEPSMVDNDDKTSKDKEIYKLMALISLSFKKIYKPTN